MAKIDRWQKSIDSKNQSMAKIDRWQELIDGKNRSMAKIDRWQELIDSNNQLIASIDSINGSLKLVDEVNRSKILIGTVANE